jgi:predicted metalloprotease
MADVNIQQTPSSGESRGGGSGAVWAVVVVILLLVIAWFVFGGGLTRRSTSTSMCQGRPEEADQGLGPAVRDQARALVVRRRHRSDCR